MKQFNKYDKINFNINEIFCNLSNEKISIKRNSFVLRLIKRCVIGILYKFGLYKLLIDSGFLQSWFKEFQIYWQTILKGRPLFFHDFHFLLGNYRSRYSEVNLPENLNKDNFLDAWQENKTIYALFGAVRRFSYEPLHCYRYERFLKNNDRILEYGCGIAPIAYSLTKYSLKNFYIDIADIRQINSHFAKLRLSNYANFIEIKPFQNCLSKKIFFYDVIFLITVMEHLPDPLVVIKNLHQSLKKDGIIIFDYIISDGDGLDTKEALKQRKQILDFIKNNFDIIEGSVSEVQSISFCVIKKK